MRRLAGILALVSSAIACGDFLGFGEDDPIATPSPADGGGDVTNAEGGTNLEPLPPGCFRRSFDPKSNGDVDAALLEQGWNTNVTGTASMAIESGQIVMRSAGRGAETEEANISFRHEGRVARVTCKTNVRISSFAGAGRFVWFRIYDTAQWDPFYSAYAEWSDGMIGAAIQATRVNDGGSDADIFPRKAAPAPGQSLPLLVEFVTSPTTFRVQLGEVDITHGPTPPGQPDVARIILGAWIPAGENAGAYELRYDRIDCVVCNVQP